jgi:hypothetical protein
MRDNPVVFYRTARASLREVQSPTVHESLQPHLPYGQKQAYRNEIGNLTLEKPVHMIKICGFLMQTKVYFFWQV